MNRLMTMNWILHRIVTVSYLVSAHTIQVNEQFREYVNYGCIAPFRLGQLSTPIQHNQYTSSGRYLQRRY